MNYTKEYTVIVPPTQSYANFTIKVTDTIGENLSITEDDLPFNVFIDTKRPRIELVGDVSYFISKGTINPFIPGVNVTDGDPRYSGGFTLSTNDTNDTIDTAINGSVYNYTYTADADPAGNPGESVSRIITIIDAEPITVTSLSIASSSGNNFANAGKTITVTLVTDGTDLGSFTGTLLGRDIAKENVNSGTVTFTATVLPGDTNENVTFSIIAINSSGNRLFVTNYDITDGSFVTIDTIKPVITVIDASNNTVLQGATYQDPGTVITDANNASYDGTATATQLDTLILGAQNITYTGPADAAGNIPDPVNRTVTVLLPKPLGIAPGLGLAPVIGITGGIKYPTLNDAYSITTTTIENSTYALVASRNFGGIEIINIDDPYNPTNVSSITNGTSFPTLYGPVSIATTTIEGSTYALVAANLGHGVQIINITDPYNPISASSITASEEYITQGAHSITTTTIRGSTYAVLAALDYHSIQIINIDEPYHPTSASSITNGTSYPELSYPNSITTATIENSTLCTSHSIY